MRNVSAPPKKIPTKGQLQGGECKAGAITADNGQEQSIISARLSQQMGEEEKQDGGFPDKKLLRCGNRMF